MDMKPVTFIYQKAKYLVGSSESGQFVIMEYSIVFNEKIGDQEVEFIDLEPSQRIYFPSYAKKTIRIHKLENESYEEIQGNNQQQKFLKIAILMENNVILIINLQDGEVQLKLHGINQEVLGLYYEDQGDQWFVVVQGGESLVLFDQINFKYLLNIYMIYKLFNKNKQLKYKNNDVFAIRKYSSALVEFQL